jgi:hypothetical protein
MQAAIGAPALTAVALYTWGLLVNDPARSMKRRVLFGLSLVLGLLAVMGAVRIGKRYLAYDDPMRFYFDQNRAAFQDLCDRFPPLGVRAIGRVPGTLTLAYGYTYLFEEPTTTQLAAAGLSREQYESVVSSLAEVAAREIRVRDGTVYFVVHSNGFLTSGSSTEFICGAAPTPLVGGTPHRGHHCSALDSGWWLCDRWN